MILEFLLQLSECILFVSFCLIICCVIWLMINDIKQFLR